ncbi:MAG: S-methyl-5-thioribose-1-phosphate isomerase, partial [Thermoplasmata archaeon]
MFIKGVGERRSVSFDSTTQKLTFIDQRKLPASVVFFEAVTLKEVISCIENMIVRGAPAIGISAAWGMAIGIKEGYSPMEAARLIKASRPTAKDLFYAVDFLLKEINRGRDPVEIAREYEEMIVEKCRQISINGSMLIKDGMNILTHCNAGALATGDWGTALGCIRYAWKEGRKLFVYVDETRPRLQGAMLTSWELMNENIPHAVIPDNAAGYYMWKKKIDMVITGADNIAANGDVANKIGTYEKAVLAKENNIPFYVAAPASTFNMSLKSGDEITVEERSENEVHYIHDRRITPEGAVALNPA